MGGNLKNSIFAVIFVVSFIFLWDAFVMSRYGPPVPSQKPATTEEALPTADKNEVVSAVVSKGDTKTTVISSGPEELIPHNRDDIRLVFKTKGAAVKNWQLKERDLWVELINQPKENQKFSTHVLETFPDLNFQVTSVAYDELVFEATDPRGFHVKKIYKLNELPKKHAVILQVTNRSNTPLQLKGEWGWSNGLIKKQVGEGAPESQEPTILGEMRAIGLGERLKSWTPGFIFGRTIDRSEKGPFNWIGVDNNYFLAAFFPGANPFASMYIKADRDNAPSIMVPYDMSLAAGQTQAQSLELFVGPKEKELLMQVGDRLEESIDYGAFGIISKGLIFCLHYFFSLTGNYGWAIVILTLFYQVLVYPLTKHSLRHTVKMKEIQPQLKKIQGQFKSDPKRLQIETFNLYKKNGMKFMGMEGCLPMLVQIPFFFAIYKALQVSYALRGAEWVLWIQNLSAPDPYYILPVVMGLATFLQQKLTAVAADPAQAKMMMIMPVFLVFIFLKMPSGLVLYWCTQSLATIAVQKYLTWRKLHQPKPAT